MVVGFTGTDFDKRPGSREKNVMMPPTHNVNLPEPQAVPVLMPALVETAFTYTVPMPVPVGTLVEAELARKTRVGAVWDGDVPPPSGKKFAVKPVARVIDLPPLPQAFRKFVDWVAEFTLAPKGAVLSLAGLAYAGKTTRSAYKPRSYVPALPQLSADQAVAAQRLTSSLAAPAKPLVLDGVTGSGKTEVYFHAIAEALAQGRQVLVMVPEIVLTHQWLERFTRTFGAAPDVWHSQQTPATRAKTWQGIARGEARVVVGARSALFLPFPKLGLIIVDEEHEASYKQEEGVLYHARDMAVVRARMEQVPVVLVSATPSLETLENLREGKYEAVHLPSRFGTATLPEVEIIDMTADAPERGEFLSPRVKAGMLATLERGEQSLLFLNRRGYAPLLLCRGCGHRFQCGDCSAWLVVHANKRLECHHCGHREPMPPACPHCQAPADKLAPCGPGVERIAEEVRAMFGMNPSPLKGEDGRGPKATTTLPLPDAREKARALRKQMTDAERKLWSMLRRDHLGVHFRKQHPIGPYIADFACVDPKIVVELDGGQHADLEAQAYDQTRTAFIEAEGFRVLRFWNDDAMRHMPVVLEAIMEAVCAAAGPLPNPPLQGEGVPRIAVLSSDEAIAAETWAAIERGEVDILVGTQMVAKGHHFPKLTFVGVVDADLGLEGADLRAAERSYQLLHQLGGRAGRGDAPGKVLVQTYQPNHPVMKALARHDRDGVMKLEMQMRREGGWPPFGQLAAILLDGVNEANVKRAGQLLAQSAPLDKRMQVLGPAPAPLSKLRGQYRYRILVKAQKGISLQGTLKNWLAGQKFPGVRVKLDVNPYYFL